MGCGFNISNWVFLEMDLFDGEGFVAWMWVFLI